GGDGGLACWRSAVAADDRGRDAHYRLGQALHRRGEARAAKSHMDRAEVLRASESQLKAELDGLIAGSAGADRFERLARLCLERRLAEEARAWYDQALRIDPTRPGLQAAIAPLATAPPLPGGPAPAPPRLPP